MKKILLLLLFAVSFTAVAQTELANNIYALKPLVTVNDTTQVKPMFRRNSDGRLVKMTWTAFASLFAGGGNLNDVLTVGNTTDKTIIFTDDIYTSEFSSAGVLWNNNNTNLQTQFLLREQEVEANFFLPAVETTGNYTLPVSFTVNGGSAVQADTNGVVALTAEGGTTPGLDAVLTENNLSSRSIFLFDEDRQMEYSKNGLAATNQGSGFTSFFKFSNPLVDGANFLLPAVTVAQDYVIPVTVNQVQPNDGGDIEIGLQEILDTSGYAENTSGQSIDISAEGIVRTKVTGFEQTITDAGFRDETAGFTSIYRAGGQQHASGVFNTEINVTVPTQNNVLIYPNKSGTLATLEDITGGGVTQVFGTPNQIVVADGAAEPVISISSTYTAARDAVANGKVTQTVTNGVTATAPSEDAVYDYMAANYDPIHTTAGLPYYDGVGGRSMVVTGASTTYLKGGTTPTFSDFTTDVRAVTSGTITPTNSSITVGQTWAQQMSRAQGQINAMTSYVGKTANYTLTTLDYCVDLTANSATFTLPTAVGSTGKQYVVKNSGSGTVLTLATTSSQTIDGTTTKTFNTQYAGIRVISDGANWKIIGTY